MTKYFIILALSFFASGCSLIETSEASHILNTNAYPPINETEVTVYLKNPDFDYIVVGIVEARGMGFTNERRDMKLAMNALKKESAAIGANGVVINNSSQEIANISANGTSTERRIKGTAIRHSKIPNKYIKSGVYAVGCTQGYPGEFKNIESSMTTINHELKEYLNKQPKNELLYKTMAKNIISEFKKLSGKDKKIICNSIDGSLKEHNSQSKI